MSRPRLSVGTFGEMLFLAKPTGHIEARARYRDWDGKLREVQATAKTRRAAEAALKEKLAGRALFKPATGDLTPDSTFAELAAYWLEDLDLEGRIAPSTRARYESLLRESVLPTFEHLTLRDIGVARCDAFVKQLARKSYNQARQAKSVMRLAFCLAVRHEVLLTCHGFGGQRIEGGLFSVYQPSRALLGPVQGRSGSHGAR
ncbi:MAG: hypothetical protein LBJ62_02145, partial [Bifidobacteriaceae bacterium]|nr:hypothetical protein [Bifidobacteriaceae bacterium]